MENLFLENRVLVNLLLISLAIFATYGVYSCWFKKKWSNKKLTAFWLLLISTLVIFCDLNGWEQGIFYALFGHSFIALAFVLANIEIRDKGKKVQPRHGLKKVELKTIGSNFLHFIVVVPIALILSVLLSLSLSEVLPWSVVNQLSLSVITLPMIWAGLMYLYLYAIKKKQVASL